MSEVDETPEEPGDGKGRPTPSRKEAEQARRERMKAPRNRKEQMKQQRARQNDARREWRARLNAGDEAVMMKRDRGPVRRFARDYVDRRFSFAEFLLPIFVLILFLTMLGPALFGQEGAAQVTTTLWLATMLALIFDCVVLVSGAKRAARKRFPNESRKRLGLYVILRSSQMRFMRVPKPQVSRGEVLPERY